MKKLLLSITILLLSAVNAMAATTMEQVWSHYARIGRQSGVTTYSYGEAGRWLYSSISYGAVVVKLTGAPNDTINVVVPSAMTASSGSISGNLGNICRAMTSGIPYAVTDGSDCTSPVTLAADGTAYLRMFPNTFTFTSGAETSCGNVPCELTGTLNVATSDGGALGVTGWVQVLDPISISEVTPWSLSLNVKPGVPSNTSVPATSLESGDWLSYFTQIPFDAQSVGCIRVTGTTSSTDFSITPPTTLTGSGGKTISLSPTVWRFVPDFTTAGCTGSPSGSAWALTPAPSFPGGTAYLTWGLSRYTTMSLPDLENNSYTGAVVFSIDYLPSE